MKFSKLILSAFMATSIVTVFSTASFAAGKMAQPHSDLKLELSKAPTLNLPLSPLQVQEPTSIKVAGRGARRARNAAGILFGLGAAAIIASEINRRHRGRAYYGYYSDDSYGYVPRRARRFHRCDRWLRRCDRGVRRACRKFYRRCDF